MVNRTATTASAGRTPAPRALRVVNGRDTRKDGQPTDSGGRVVEPAPKFKREAPAKPEHGLSAHAEWLWDRVVDQMSSVGLLKPIDGAALEALCETFARWRDAVEMRQANGLTHNNSQGQSTAPWVGIEERAGKEFRAWCAEFGITPAAERHLTVPDGGDGVDLPF